MPFLDKDKASIALVLPKNTFMPGETISGTMNLTVIATFKCTALRVHLRGKETKYVRRRNQSNNNVNGNATSTSTHDIFEQVATVLGEQSGKGSRGSIELEPGNYSYPFSLQFPFDLPPTYALDRPRYGGAVRYDIKGVVDIPMGYDNEIKYELVVYKQAPLSQMYEVRAAPAIVPTVRSDIATMGCTGCFCNHETDSYLLTTALLVPYVAITNRSAASTFPPSSAPVPKETSVGIVQSQPPIAVSGDPSVISLRIVVENHTKKTTVTTARVRLTQYVKYNHRGDEHSVRLFERVVIFDNGGLQPHNAAFSDIQIPVCDSGVNPSELFPTFAGHYVKVHTELEVDFPDVKADNTMLLRDVVQLVNGIDPTNTARPV